MPSLPPALTPAEGERGVLTGDPRAAGRRTLAAWDAIIVQAAGTDLRATARAKGRLGREVLLPLGAWPQTRSLAQVLKDAREGRTSEVVDLDREEREVLAAQAEATDDEVVAGLQRARDELAKYLASRSATKTWSMTTASPLGPLPVLTLLHAIGYQLAVAALDLEPCGAAADDELLEHGVAALVDTTGALAARQGVTGSITALLPGVAWGFGAADGSWRTTRLDRTAEPDGPAVEATARLIVDVTAGRELNVPGRWRDGSLVTHDLPGLLRLAPVLEQVPGIPGGAALRTASRAIGGLSRVAGLLGGYLSGGKTSG